MTLAEDRNPDPLPQLLGYVIVEQLYAGSRTNVYRAVENGSQRPVILKVLQQEYFNVNNLLQFRNQYTIAKHLDIPGIICPYRLEAYGNTYALVMEDFGGISLREYCRNQRLALTDVLAIALQLADILKELHQHRVIHKDIKPANILIHPESKQIKLIDFSIASLLPKETQEIKNPDGLEGTLAYIAPEQTGRMNRGIDYRADFYAFGVTLFELLTGQLPFPSTDPMELVYCHIAKQPPSLDPSNIPSVMGEIVHKLMAKNAEDRYQSILGLKHDLETCWHQLKTKGTIAPFAIGSQDMGDRLLIPEKLYGREAEVQTLLASFERVTQGATELMLVAGFSGIGKTAVINEVHKPIVRQRGYFIKGKYDQFNRNIPFAALVQAFRDLIRQLLSQPDWQLQVWKTDLANVLEDSAQVLIEMIPELEHILGVQPPVPELSGAAAQNRLHLLFQKFIQVFTAPDHPLVLFLDDLQWVDSASLALVQSIMSKANTGYLLVIGAYRDNEVPPTHPLMVALNELEQSQTKITTITLQPLSEANLNCLIADTLHCSEQLTTQFTHLAYQKTKGNPFFVTQFLKALHQEQLITFDSYAGHWQCDLTQVREAALTDDVVEFMAQQLQKLPTVTQKVLQLASCIGNQFDLDTLAIISQQSPLDTANHLWRALQEGLILPVSETYKFFQADAPESENYPAIAVSYKFLHDRVQQAAYSLIPEAQAALTHWQIGQLLLQGLSPPQQDERIFDIVNQLNLGKAATANSSQPQQLAQLNLRAGEKARLSAAYQAACTYFTSGIDLLPFETWQTDYGLIYALHRQGAEAAYLSGNFDRAENLYRVALTQAQTPLDKAAIYRLQMTQYHLQGRNAEAIAIQRQSLQLLGWTVPEDPESIQASLDEQIAYVNGFLEQQTIASILEFARMTDESIAEMLRILQIFFYTAWLGGQTTLALLAAAKMAALSLQYGNSAMSPWGYASYGLIAVSILKNNGMAYQFGDLAVNLCEQFDNDDVKVMTNFIFAADLHSWCRPLREADPYYNNALKYGMNAGNWLTVSFMMMQSGSDRLTYGKNLDELYEIAQTHVAFLRQIKSVENLDALVVGVLQPIRQLLGLTRTPFSFDDESFSESEYLQRYHHSPYHLAWFYSVKIRHAYLFDQPFLFPDLIAKLSIIEDTIPTHAKVPSSVFYVILMHLALIERANDAAESHAHWQAIRPLEERLARWEEDCPENIQHKRLLIQAEKARLTGRNVVASEFYDSAIASANAQGYLYEEALANERAAKFYLDWCKEKLAASYMQAAHSCYLQWGAKAKVSQLEFHYPQILSDIQTPDSAPALPSAITRSVSSTSTDPTVWLDLPAVMKAAQAISQEIELDKLLATLMQIAITNAGAQKGYLILRQEQQWLVVAQADLQQAMTLSIPLDECKDVSQSLIYSVARTQTAAVFEHLSHAPSFAGDRYVLTYQPKSALCMPISRQGNMVGILYLENNLAIGAFTGDRLEVLQLLISQAAISLENARLYQQVAAYSQTLETEVARKTQALQQKTHDLEETLKTLQQTQAQLIHTEKMSSLGQLVAGIAHEINNPVSFIQGNIPYVENYVTEILNLLALYQQEYPQPCPTIETKVQEIALDFLSQDLFQILKSMTTGSDRIEQIVASLRNFSRLDETGFKDVDIHSGIESTLLILQNRLYGSSHQPAIQVVKEYGQIPKVTCFPSQLNQVFLHIINNAIDAIRESGENNRTPEIQIRTEITNNKQLRITIANTGPVIPEAIQPHIFEPFFTTKPVGEGAGLGLFISYSIIQKHSGTLKVRSQPGENTEFEILLPQPLA
ncbi:MAG: AAA family ATPase [Synechococcales bacterium]|nr:AAA family ATPase [Synechococcales bacterium]